MQHLPADTISGVMSLVQIAAKELLHTTRPPVIHMRVAEHTGMLKNEPR